MTQKEKIVLMIPAHNEEKTLKNLLPGLMALKKVGVCHEVVVVNDGSTDHTGKVALSFGAKVLTLPKNYGKAYAFYEGAKVAKQMKATVFVTLDSDLEHVTKRQLEALIRPVLRGDVKMSVGTVVDRKTINGIPVHDSTIVSGQRAFQMQALEPLLIHNPKWEKFFGIHNGQFCYRTGFGLERALNQLLVGHTEWMYGGSTGKKIVVRTEFNVQRGALQITSKKQMDREMASVDWVNNARKNTARIVRSKRKEDPAEARKRVARFKRRTK
ncbi:MAG: glycosyltransferase [Candidatus Diapherotrites archaeon]|uniref:Glycosyltransferase n=1 Tax=Candidatus Iainarchaeum sp. TaxID=3101447 RepID=A0A8T4L3V4_9ARCH|nr:glycosyltransferase [Candidatus Diapherotrites archaeon]